jgi:hypothetical protein
MSRASSQPRIGHFQRFYRQITRQRVCVFCGVRATAYDHFVPISVVTMLVGILDAIPGKVLLPTCGECNAIAGDRVFPTVAAKRRYIHTRLRFRYRKLLAMPHWSDAELAELGYALQDFVRAGMARRQWLLERLAWRNTSNSEPVQLAAIRSPFGAAGKGSAGRPANSGGTTRNGGKSSSRGDLAV